MSNEYKDWQRDNAVDAKIAEVKSLQSQLDKANALIDELRESMKLKDENIRALQDEVKEAISK